MLSLIFHGSGIENISLNPTSRFTQQNEDAFKTKRKKDPDASCISMKPVKRVEFQFSHPESHISMTHTLWNAFFHIWIDPIPKNALKHNKKCFRAFEKLIFCALIRRRHIRYFRKKVVGKTKIKISEKAKQNIKLYCSLIVVVVENGRERERR